MSELFESRHIGPDASETTEMLRVIGAPTLDALMDEAIPARIRLPKPLNLPHGQSEQQFLGLCTTSRSRNQVFAPTSVSATTTAFTPSVILRNVLENPGWYTPYTPYQAEIAQGASKRCLNFQTMVRDLTGMQVANASLLDEADRRRHADAECLVQVQVADVGADRRGARSICDLHPRQVADHRLEIEQRFEAPLSDLGLIRRVRRIPTWILEDVSQNHARRESSRSSRDRCRSETPGLRDATSCRARRNCCSIGRVEG